MLKWLLCLLIVMLAHARVPVHAPTPVLAPTPTPTPTPVPAPPALIDECNTDDLCDLKCASDDPVPLCDDQNECTNDITWGGTQCEYFEKPDHRDSRESLCSIEAGSSAFDGVCCGGGCVDLNTSAAHCGACRNDCATQLLPGALVGCCNATCVDFNNNTENCGCCGNACPVGARCFQGSCTKDVGSFCDSHGECTLYNCYSGICKPKRAGTPCEENTECLSGRCTDNICEISLPGEACLSTVDCLGNGSMCFGSDDLDNGMCS